MNPHDQPPPAFLFYVNDFLVGTSGMSIELRMVYLLFLCAQWRAGGPVDLLKTCDWIAGELRVRPHRVQRLLQLLDNKLATSEDGRRYSPRLEAERQKVLKAKFSHRPGGRARANGATRDHGRFSPADTPADGG